MLDFDFTFFNSWCGGGDEVVVVGGLFCFLLGGWISLGGREGGGLCLVEEHDGLVEMTHSLSEFLPEKSGCGSEVPALCFVLLVLGCLWCDDMIEWRERCALVMFD